MCLPNHARRLIKANDPIISKRANPLVIRTERTVIQDAAVATRRSFGFYTNETKGIKNKT
jgi:hypothetical protein